MICFYTAERIKADVEANVERLFAPWALGRSENWKPDPATKSLIALGYWVDEELARFCSDEDRRTQIQAYNRLSRTYDIYEIAADILNAARQGNIEKNRRGHRRWG